MDNCDRISDHEIINDTFKVMEGQGHVIWAKNMHLRHKLMSFSVIKWLL